MASSKALQARPLLVFFILAVAIALVAMAIRATDPAALGIALREMFTDNERADIISGVRYSLETPVLWNAILFPAAPTLAAFVVIWLAYGRRGLGAWMARLAPWRGMSWREGIGVWLAVFVAFLAFIALYALYTASHDQLDAWPALVDRYGGGFEIAIFTLALSLVLSSGPLLEEMGWRAFALPLLLTRFSPVLASVGVGLLWAFWHLPREIAPLMSGADGVWMSFLYKQLDFIPGCIAASIIATFLYFKLGGSVWGGILAHALHNEMVVNVMRTPEPVYMIGDFALGSMTAAEVTVAAILIIVTKGRLGAESTTYREPHPFLRPEN